jgi:hypothetical protein
VTPANPAAWVRSRQTHRGDATMIIALLAVLGVACRVWIRGSYLFATYCGDPAVGSRRFQMRQNRSTGVWDFVNPRTGAWAGTSH